jgi:hypothetical protein
MKTRRLLVLAVAGLAVVVLSVLVVSAYWERKQPVFNNAPQLMGALRAFSRDQAARGERLPAEISLQDLLRGGYVTINDVRAFQGMQVSFSTQADDNHPPIILARARTPGGEMICLMADGSVQQFSQSRYEEMRTNLSQEGPANGSQPICSDTNSTSGAAGVHR